MRTGYGSGFDREVGMYFAFLAVTLVGAIGAFSILRAIERVDWSAEAKYEWLVSGSAEAATRGIPAER